MGLFNFLFGKSNSSSSDQQKQSANSPSHIPEEYVKLLSFRATSFKESEWAYSFYKKMIAEINPNEPFTNPPEPAPLFFAERYFLKYIDGLPTQSPFIAQKWFYEQGFYYPSVFKKFLSQGYLTVTPIPNLNKVTVAQLKEALGEKGISTKGKKADLVKLITDNFSASDYLEIFNAQEKFYALTPLGKTAVKSLPKSATYDIELEDRCFELICAGKFEEAASSVREHDRAIGRIRGLSSLGPSVDTQMRTSYTKMLQDTSGAERSYKAVMIVCDMLGVPDRSHLLMRRLFGELDPALLHDTKQDELEAFTKGALDDMLADEIEEYEFLATLDDETCPVCGALDGKHFKISDAKIGANCPPMHEDCRCTVLPYIKAVQGVSASRAARDPKAGKSIRVKERTYTE